MSDTLQPKSKNSADFAYVSSLEIQNIRIMPDFGKMITYAVFSFPVNMYKMIKYKNICP